MLTSDSARTLGEGTKFLVDNLGIDRSETCKRSKATVRSRHDLIYSNDAYKTFNSLPDEFWMLNEISRTVDNPRYQNLVVGNFSFSLLENRPLVRVPGIRGFEKKIPAACFH